VYLLACGTGVRLGLYDPVKRALSGDSARETLAVKLGAAVLTSAAGISIAQPSDVIKVRCADEAVKSSGMPASLAEGAVSTRAWLPHYS